jgi:hypothetical protein
MNTAAATVNAAKLRIAARRARLEPSWSANAWATSDGSPSAAAGSQAR